MTVFDELNGFNEYLEMDFVEYLEFIVRISYLSPDKVNSDIAALNKAPLSEKEL